MCRSARPFGIAILLGGFDIDGTPSLWLSDPSGTYSSWKAYATGRNSKTVNEWLEKHYKELADDALVIKQAVRALLEVVESGDGNIEVAVLTAGQKLRKLTPPELKAVVEAIAADKKREEEEAAAAGPAAAAASKK